MAAAAGARQETAWHMPEWYSGGGRAPSFRLHWGSCLILWHMPCTSVHQCHAARLHVLKHHGGHSSRLVLCYSSSFAIASAHHEAAGCLGC